MSNYLECPHCSFQNHKDANFCEECGRPLRKSRRQPADRNLGLANWFVKRANKILDVTDDFLDAFSSQSSIPKQGSSLQVNKSSAGSNIELSGLDQDVTVKEYKKAVPKEPGKTISYFQILETIPLTYSNYYKVYATRCENCGKDNLNNPNLSCSHCQKPLRKHVIRESITSYVLQESYRRKVINLSELITGVLKHNLIFYLDSIQYILLDGFPEPWFCLGKPGTLPIKDEEKIITWLTQIGNCLKRLHSSGYSCYDEKRQSDWIESILVLKNQQAYLADISGVVPFGTDKEQAIRKDILYLAKILYTMVTGSRENLSANNYHLHDVPTSYKEVIMKAIRGDFTTVDGFLNLLQQKSKGPNLARSLRQLVGYGTDIGKSRDHNEDYVSKFSLGLEQIPGTPEVGLYIVADGMGGHQAGEKASESVIKDVVINRIQEQMQKLQAVPKLKRATIKLDDVLTPGEILSEAINQANQVLLNVRKSTSGSDRGTTITAALIVGNTCTIANVGDSRTYLMRGNRLEQITQDHSVVAKLVASGMITPAEVRSHPQRNQIFRTLGDKPQVEVDIFQKTLAPGDQLLLCSDGLWEMVLDQDIGKVMINARTPQSACDRLIEAANAGGGDDNISVIVVWLE